MDYITYLEMFDQLYDIPKERKTGEYKKYLLTIIEYLSWFVQRIKPLIHLDDDLNKQAEIVADQWETGTLPGWPVSILSLNFISKISHLLIFTERSWFCTDQCWCTFGTIRVFITRRVGFFRS